MIIGGMFVHYDAAKMSKNLSIPIDEAFEMIDCLLKREIVTYSNRHPKKSAISL